MRKKAADGAADAEARAGESGRIRERRLLSAGALRIFPRPRGISQMARYLHAARAPAGRELKAAPAAEGTGPSAARIIRVNYALAIHFAGFFRARCRRP